jgi:subtilisin family serine protease
VLAPLAENADQASAPRSRKPDSAAGPPPAGRACSTGAPAGRETRAAGKGTAMRVLVQFRSSPQAHAATLRGEAMPPFAATTADPIAGLVIDPAFAAVQVPTPQAAVPGASPYRYSPAVRFSTAPEQATYLLRGTLPDDPDAQRDVLAQATARPEVVGVFADPVIATCLVCPGDPPVGGAEDVARLLGVKALADAGMDGNRVAVAVVDTGVSLAHLEAKGRDPKFSAARSWTPAGVATRPGRHPVGHGTMCAYDIGIAAPKATLLDHAVLLSETPGETSMSGLLSDAVLAYAKLLGVVQAMPAARRALVVNNSWGMFSPAWDFPVGHPGNYSDNPAHPFNVIVASLEAAGADILFAAGNCGRDCPDGRCAFGAGEAGQPICGANSHPSVLSVAGVDTKKRRVGYSSQGPGRLAPAKPDLSAYTHFKGSGVFPADGGTSAACPVAAGVVAAVRGRYPASVLSPAELRALLCKTAEDLGGTGFDHDFGWGAVDASALATALAGVRRSAGRRARSTGRRGGS